MPLTVFTKRFMLDVWQVSEYVSEMYAEMYN